MEKYIETNSQKINSINKLLLLIGIVFRKGPSNVFSSFEEILENIIKVFKSTPLISELAAVLLEKAKLHGKIQKCVNGNFYLF